MRDQSHDDFIERWVSFMREHPTEWKRIHTEFINAQFEKTSAFILRLRDTKDGEEKIIQAYGIKNKAGYPTLFRAHR